VSFATHIHAHSVPGDVPKSTTCSNASDDNDETMNISLSFRVTLVVPVPQHVDETRTLNNQLEGRLAGLPHRNDPVRHGATDVHSR
jgi:hypothetical protein